MGKLAGAAAAVAVPEAAAARKIVPGMSGQETRDELQRRRREAAARSAARKTGPAATPAATPAAPAPPSSGAGAGSTTSTPPAPATPAPAGGVTLPSLPASGAVQTSSGFLLGLFLWGWVGLPYLRGGAPEVRRTLAAKFLNKTTGG